MNALLNFLHRSWSILGKALEVYLAIAKKIPHLYLAAVPLVALGIVRLARLVMENLDQLGIVKDQMEATPSLDIIVPAWAAAPLSLLSPYVDFQAFILAIGTIMTVWVTTAVYRLVKSWVPTLSG